MFTIIIPLLFQSVIFAQKRNSEGYFSTFHTTKSPPYDSEKHTGIRNQIVCAGLCLGSSKCKVYMYDKDSQVCHGLQRSIGDTFSNHKRNSCLYGVSKTEQSEALDILTDFRECQFDTYLECEEGHLTSVRKFFLRKQDSINCISAFERTPILAAASGGQMEVVEMLLNLGADLKHVDKYNNNILHLTCGRGNVDTVKRLLESGLDMESLGESGMTPIFNTLMHDNILVFDYLVSRGCNVNAVSNQGSTIIHFASGQSLKMLKHILSYKFNKIGIEDKNVLGQTPVHLAVRHDKIDIVKYLLKMGCNMKAKANNGFNVLHYASKYASNELRSFILSLNVARYDDKAKSGITPKQLAMKRFDGR